jgi:hypothetical protein
MFRRYASSLLLAGLLFADGSWLGRLEQLLGGFLGGGNQSQAVWAMSDYGGTFDPNNQPLPIGNEPASGGTPKGERGGSIDPNG